MVQTTPSPVPPGGIVWTTTETSTLPILAIQQRPTCIDQGGCIVTDVTVQFPYSLPYPVGFGLGQPEGFTLVPRSLLTISQAGSLRQTFEVGTQMAVIHFFTSCDLGGIWDYSDNCDDSIIVRSDNSYANRLKPATEGEVLTTFAYGLGPVSGAIPVAAGEASPDGARADLNYTLAFEYTVRLPDGNIGIVIEQAEVRDVSLSPGEVGKYRITFVVPPLPPGLVSCNAVAFNARLRLSTGTNAFESTDTITTCVR